MSTRATETKASRTASGTHHPGRGGRELSTHTRRTDPESVFLRAQIQGWGG